MSAHKSAKTEWAGCLTADLTVVGSPAKGGTFTVSGAVSAEVDRADTDITLELPSNLALVDAPGMTRAAGRESSGAATATLARQRRDLQAWRQPPLHRPGARAGVGPDDAAPAGPGCRSGWSRCCR